MELICDKLSIWDSPEDNMKPVNGPDPSKFMSIDQNSCEVCKSINNHRHIKVNILFLI